jgi:hypothetical protein
MRTLSATGKAPAIGVRIRLSRMIHSIGVSVLIRRQCRSGHPKWLSAHSAAQPTKSAAAPSFRVHSVPTIVRLSSQTVRYGGLYRGNTSNPPTIESDYLNILFLSAVAFDCAFLPATMINA